MFKLPRVPDIAPVYGMNDVDDIRFLPAGQCRRLVNARPDNPPEVRAGSIHRFLAGTDGYTIIPPAISYKDDSGTVYIISIVFYNNNYLLVKINPSDTSSFDILGTAAGHSSPEFAMVKAHNAIYLIMSEEAATWDGAGYPVGNKIIELNSDADVVRSMSLTVSPQVLSVTLASGGDWDADTVNFVGYSFSYVRRTDAEAFTELGEPQEIYTYLPGAIEGPDNDDYSETIEITGTSQKILINTLAGITNRIQAKAEGATHLRVYKTPRQTTEENANAATKYFAKDLPLLSNYAGIEDIFLDDNPVKITTSSAHGLSDTDVIRVYGVAGTTELNGNDYTVAQQDGDSSFRLASTNPSDFSKYEGGGTIVSDAINITNITLPDNKITVTLTDPLVGTDGLFGNWVLTGLTGASELNNVLLTFSEKVSDYILKFDNPNLEIAAYSSGGSLYQFHPQTRHVAEVDLSNTYARVRVIRYKLFTGDYGETLVGQTMTFKSFLDVSGNPANDWNGSVVAVTSIISGEWAYGDGVRWDFGDGVWVELDILSSSLQEVTSAPGSGWRDIPVYYGYYMLQRTATSVFDVDNIVFDTDKVTITTDGAHAFSNDDVIVFDGLGGSVELNGTAHVISEASGSEFKISYSESQGVSAYTTGGECGKKIVGVDDVFLCYPLITASNHGMTTGDYVVFLDILGTTELNDNSYPVIVVDEDSFYPVGPDSNDLTDYAGEGYLYAGGVIFEDDITEAELVADPAAQLVAFNYAAAPLAKFVAFAKNRIWLFGIPNQAGRCNYSEYAGGDDGTPTDLALAYPQKFSSWFKANYSFICDAYGQEETGVAVLGTDIFFMFEEHIHALYGADPTYSGAQEASPDIGCVFPFTIVKANIESAPFYGQCILFMSNRGPAYIKSGGEIGLFSDFKIKELWPDKSTELFGDLIDNKEYIQRNCTAGFWNDCWWIMYTNSDGVHRFYSYYFNPELKSDDTAPRGPWVVEQAEV